MHKLQTTDEQIQCIREICAVENIPTARNTADQSIPSPRQGPIPLLPVHTNGIACKRCPYCCISVKVMIKHILSTHGEDQANPKECMRQPVHIQTLFQSPRKYFEVESILADASVYDILPVLFQKVIPAMPPVFTGQASSTCDRTPFMQFFQWDLLLEDISQDRTQRNLAEVLKAPPAKNDVPYQTLAKAIHAYYKLAAETINNASDSFLLRQHLSQGKELSESRCAIL